MNLRGIIVAPVLALAAMTTAVALVPTMEAATASGSISVSPSAVTFPNATVGAACSPGPGCTYAEVTLTNTSAVTVTLTTATASPNPPFYPTFGGTCNVTYAYHIPANTSCTFQWGFRPVHHGKTMGTGTIFFDNGDTVTVGLTGKGTH